MKSLLALFARNEIFANTIILIVFLFGGFAVFNLIRENFPEFSLDMISISVVYPGADPTEVENGICQTIETAIEGLDGIKNYTTIAAENLGSAFIEVKKNYDVKEMLIRLNAVMQSVDTFPQGAEKPVIYEMTAKSPVMLLYLTGDMSERRLKEWAEGVKKEIQSLPQVSQIHIFGKRDYEIAVEVSEEKLREYGLSFDTVISAIRRNDLNLAGGSLNTSQEEIRLRTLGRKETAADLGDIVVLTGPDGDTVPLRRVAHIIDDFAEDPISAKIDGKQSLLVMVFKNKDEDSLAISEAVTQYVENKRAQIPSNLSLNILYDNTELLRARINLLIENGLSGLAIVVFLLWIFLNGRLAFWVAMGIPFSGAATLLVLWWMGETINMISLFGLIMVLGIVVDDATVVAETIYVHRAGGARPLAAAIGGLNEVAVGVASSSFTTVVTFLPLLFVDGVMGRFIAILPTVVITTLLISLFESLFLLPSHLSHLPDPSMEKASAGIISRWVNRLREKVKTGLTWFENGIYIRLLGILISFRYVTFCVSVCLLLITFGLIKGGMLKMQLFGEVDGFIISSTVEFPEGTPPRVTADAIQKIDEALHRLTVKNKTLTGEPLVAHRLALVGQTIEENSRKGGHLGSVQAILLDSEDRGIPSSDLLVQWEEEIGTLPGTKSLTFSEMSGGPPGAAIEIGIQGENMDAVLAAAKDVEARLHKFKGVYQIHSDNSRGKEEMRLRLKPEAAGFGFTAADLARQIYTGYYGVDVVRLQRNGEEVKVKVRYTAEERSSLADFEDIRVRSMDGRQVPLLSVANIDFEKGLSTIIRSNGFRRITVSADVNTNQTNTNEVYAELRQNYFNNLPRRFPGISVVLEGEEKKMSESLRSLILGFPMGIIGVFVIIAATFRSYAQPLLIMVTIPFAMVGSIFGHYLLGYDYTLMSIFGTVAVSGIVVNDAIVLVEKVNDLLAEGMPFFGAVILGASRRFRAIILTTATTVAGLAPLILETDFQAKFLIPMAIALAAGNLASTVLVIFQLPCLVVILNDLRMWMFYRRHGYWPTRRSVEPAAYRNYDESNIIPIGGDKKHELPMPWKENV